MLDSKLVSENEEYIREAIDSGIDADTVSSTLEKAADTSSKQVTEVVKTIADMKSEQNIRDERYLSEFVKENNQKIQSAINEGITPEEVSNTLIKESNVNDRSRKKHLKFVVNLISKMKRKELKKRKSNKKQFILTKNDNKY